MAWTLAVLGCNASSSTFEFVGSPFHNVTGTGGSTGPGGTGVSGSGSGAGGGAAVDPCDEQQARKFIRLSLANADADDHVHYFLMLVAFVNGEEYPDGAVCADDVSLYTSFGYSLIPAGSQREFGNFCVVGPALLYFHRNGQFRSAGGGTGGTALASAIAPAQGTVRTYDAFFTSAGAQVPVPDFIILHNPGTGDGARLKISRNSPSPCDPTVIGGDPPCNQDAFYYVDENDIMAGSTALGVGSGRRTPNEIQQTGCAGGFNDPSYELAPSNASANSALDNQFLRGGKVDLVFLRNDQDPPIPQAVWRVTDASGAVVHNFDSRSGVP